MAITAESILFCEASKRNWHMTYAERCAFLFILDKAKPDVSLEIGTFHGGSLHPLSQVSRNVTTVDIDSNQHRIAPDFSNVEFMTGDSAQLVPSFIDRMNLCERELNFVLVDGSHETASVRADINACLRYKPKSSPLFIVMHDSSNLNVRRGIIESAWSDCLYAHELHLDFVPGSLYDRHDIQNEVWGGLALAVLLPEERTTDFNVSKHFDYSLYAFQEFIGLRS